MSEQPRKKVLLVRKTRLPSLSPEENVDTEHSTEDINPPKRVVVARKISPGQTLELLSGEGAVTMPDDAQQNAETLGFTPRFVPLEIGQPSANDTLNRKKMMRTIDSLQPINHAAASRLPELTDIPRSKRPLSSQNGGESNQNEGSVSGRKFNVTDLQAQSNYQATTSKATPFPEEMLSQNLAEKMKALSMERIADINDRYNEHLARQNEARAMLAALERAKHTDARAEAAARRAKGPHNAFVEGKQERMLTLHEQHLKEWGDISSKLAQRTSKPVDDLMLVKTEQYRAELEKRVAIEQAQPLYENTAGMQRFWRADRPIGNLLSGITATAPTRKEKTITRIAKPSGKHRALLKTKAKPTYEKTGEAYAASRRQELSTVLDAICPADPDFEGIEVVGSQIFDEAELRQRAEVDIDSVLENEIMLQQRSVAELEQEEFEEQEGKGPLETHSHPHIPTTPPPYSSPRAQALAAASPAQQTPVWPGRRCGGQAPG